MDTKRIDSRTRAIREAALGKLRTDLGIEERPPYGWVTCKQIAQITRTTPRNATIIIHEWMPQGLIEMRKFRINTGQMFRLVPHYAFAPRLAKIYGLPVASKGGKAK